MVNEPVVAAHSAFNKKLICQAFDFGVLTNTLKEYSPSGFRLLTKLGICSFGLYPSAALHWVEYNAKEACIDWHVDRNDSPLIPTIACLLQGEGVFCTCDTEIPISEGDVIFHNSTRKHGYKHGKGHASLFLVLFVHTSLLKKHNII